MRSPALLSTLSAAAALAALGAAATPAAAQVPPTLQLAGRLTDPAGTPLDGAYDVEVRLYGAVTGGTAVWTEPHDSVVADAGSIFLALGAEVPLSADVFDGSPRWLEIRIDGTALAPRLPVGSVPYAFRADVAAMLGDYAPEDLQPRIAAACAPGSSIRAIDDDGALTCEPDDVGAGDVTAVAAGAGLLGGGATGDVALAVDPAYVQRRVAGTCATGSSIRTIAADGTVTCETDDDSGTTYSGGAGITVSGTTVSLSSAGCAAGEVWKWSGTAWACEPDASASYTGGAGITVSGTAVSLSSAGCAAGEVWKWSGTAWACEPDVDTNTTYTAGSGLTLGGTTLSTDNAVVARKDAAAGNQAFDGTTMVLDYTNNRVGIGTAAPRELLHVAGPAEIASLRLFRKYGNNGTVSCETYCRGGWDGGRSGICLAAKATEFVPDEPPRRIYVDCDVLPGLGTDPTCICGEVIE